jgi:hypothetical protein
VTWTAASGRYVNIVDFMRPNTHDRPRR